MTNRYDVPTLRAFASQVLQKAGLTEPVAGVVADGLLEADLFGHSTHGLGLLADYVSEIEAGTMARDGEPVVRHDFGAVANWDAAYLPGIWTTHLAVTEACKRAKKHGLGAISIARSHHIGCLAVFVERPARDNFATLVMCSDPSDAMVAPSGGITPALTPNPIAAGIPAEPDPIIMDISMSITTAGQCARAKREGQRLAGDWLIDASGTATNDPRVLDKGGALMPLGGLDHGHKGFALGLLVDTLTQGLSGYGRAQEPDTWGAAVLVMAFAPELFGQGDVFIHQVTDIVNRCRQSQAINTGSSVRIPGERALANKRAALQSGLQLHSAVNSSVEALSQRFNIPL
jgi:L-lactate dehydrogenase